MDIQPGPGIGRVSSSLKLSVSSSLSRSELSYTGASVKAKQLKPFATEDIRILLLENINETGRDILTKQGYQVEALKTSLSEDALIEKIRWSHTPSLTNSGMTSNISLVMYMSLAYDQRRCSLLAFSGRLKA